MAFELGDGLGALGEGGRSLGSLKEGELVLTGFEGGLEFEFFLLELFLELHESPRFHFLN